MSGPMIRVTGDDCQCPIKLFGHEGPHDLMRHGQGTEGDDQLGVLEDLGIEPVRAADDAGKTSHAVVPPLPDTPGERVARGALAPLVEDDEGRISGAIRYGGGLFGAPVILATRPALGKLDDVQSRKSEITPEALDALPIALDKLPLRAAFQTAHGQQAQPQRRQPSSADVVLRTVGAPHLLEVVETTHLGTENVDQDVACIDQHPVAGRHALDPRISEAPVLELLDHAIGNRTHMAVRAAGCHEHGVCDGGFACEVQLDRVFGLHVLKASQGDGPDILIKRSIRSGERGRRIQIRLKRRKTVQVQVLSSSAPPRCDLKIVRNGTVFQRARAEELRRRRRSSVEEA